MPSPEPSAAEDLWAAYGNGWSRLHPPPEQREGDAWVWIGDEVLVAGGCDAGVEDSCRETQRAFAFDPTTRSWHRVPSAIEAMAGAAAVWTGTEAIFLETYPGEPGPIAGQAYDTVADTWRRIARAPLTRAYGVVSVWTGDELILWGGGDRGEERTEAGAAYDPATDTWRRIADAPIGLNLASGVWTGREVVVFGSLLSRANRAPMPTSVGAAYDPASDTWRVLSPSALSPQATAAAWVQDRLVAWDYEVHSQEYDPTSDRWSAPMRMPLSFGECYPQSVMVSGFLFAWFCGHAALYDESIDGWERLEGGPLEETIYSEAYKRDLQVWRFADLVPAGSAVVMPMQGLTLSGRGIACFGCEDSPNSFWVYRPPNDVVPTAPTAGEPGRRAARDVVQDFLDARLFGAEGRWIWLATSGGLGAFLDAVPRFHLPSGFGIRQIRRLDGAVFRLDVRLGLRSPGHRWRDATRQDLTFLVGPGRSVGGDELALVIVDVDT